MIRRTSLLGAVALSALLACQQAMPELPPPGDLARTGAVLKTVNGQQVTQDMLDAMIGQLPDQLRTQLESTGQIDQMAEQLVIQEILYQQAIAQKLHQDPEIKNAMAVVARSTLADHMIRREVETRATDAAVQKWYDEHAVQYARPQIQLAHVMVKTEDEAKAIKAQLDGGADFAVLAKASSLDTRTSGDGGVLGWVKPQDIGPLGAAVEGVAKGATTDPVNSGRAWHVLKVMDTRDSVPLEEVKDQILDELKAELAEAYIKEVKENATIVDGAGGASVTTDPAAAGAGPGKAPAGNAPAAPAAPAKAPAAPAAGGQ